MTATEPTQSVEESAFLRAILEHPEDDAARLVYADWLQENGQEPRAEFIRVQCELSRIPRCVNCGDTGSMHYGSFVAACRWCDARRYNLRRRERELRQRYTPIWFALPGLAVASVWDYPPEVRWCEADDHHEGIDIVTGDTARGFIASVTCTAADWLRHADTLVWHPGQTVECPATAQPITRVVLTDMAGADIEELCRRVRERVGREWFDGSQGCRDVLAVMWPGITFELSGDTP